MHDERRRVWEERHRSDDTIAAPSPFVVRALDALATTNGTTPNRRALDIACGRGRHALLLAARGYEVVAVDFAQPALATLARAAAARDLEVMCLAADVGAWPLPLARFALVIVVDFLDRRLFPALRAAVAPGGALLYETFRRGDDPSASAPLRPDFTLTAGELDELCRPWRVLLRADTPVVHNGRTAIRAGILAVRPLGAPH